LLIYSVLCIGCCYSTDVLSTHHVESLTHCAGQLSLKLETYVGFKYSTTNDNRPNCERFKKMENCSERAATGSKNEGWKFYKAVPTTQVSTVVHLRIMEYRTVMGNSSYRLNFDLGKKNKIHHYN
jgi:hypothetical protein